MKWKRKHAGSDAATPPQEPVPNAGSADTPQPKSTENDMQDLVQHIERLAKVIGAPRTLTDADCVYIPTNLTTFEQLEELRDNLDLITRQKVWTSSARQLEAVQTSMSKNNGKLIIDLVENGKATLYVCYYRTRRTGCFFFGIGFDA